MKAVLKYGTTIELTGADIKEIKVSIHDEIILVLHSGWILNAKSITAKEK